MKDFCFLFVAYVPGIKHETWIPADTFSEAFEALGRNAALTVNVPATHWHFVKKVSN